MSRSIVESDLNPTACGFDEASLWPLPLTPFERFMVLDDRPGFPMAFYGELRFTGELRRKEFEEALHASLRYHPLLRARVDADDEGTLRWLPVEDFRLLPDWGCFDTSIRADDETKLDVTKRPGVRIWVRSGSAASYLVWQFHHACCDGQGAMRFIEDVLTQYAAATSQDAALPDVRPVELARLKTRGDYAGQIQLAARHPRSVRHQVFDALKFHCLAPRPLVERKNSEDSREDCSFPGVFSRFFSLEESTAIRTAASDKSGTLNDAAIVAVLQAVNAWNAEQGRGGRGRLRVLMPIDLRLRGDELLPAANRMTFGFITRRAAELRDPARLLEGVRDETQFVRRTGAGLDFLHVLKMLERSAWLPWLLRKRRCMATAVLTNMGDPTRRFAHRFPRQNGRCVIGNVVLESITGSPPIRPLTRVGFGIGTYAGRIVINAKCDPALYSDSDVQRILQLFADALRRGAE
ncbi:MAG: hypothetical protein C0483_10035 [Pirellula sp.]|nr:hypothetical protein [Pirellula sp.]